VVVVAAKSDDRQLVLLDDSTDCVQIDPGDHARALVGDSSLGGDNRFGQHAEGDLLGLTELGQFVGDAPAFLCEAWQGFLGDDEPVGFVLEPGAESGPQFVLEGAALAENEHDADTVGDQFADFAEDGVGDGRVFDGLAFDLDHEDPSGELAVVEVGGHGKSDIAGVMGWDVPL
jgi:hypothetical protein